MARQSTGLGTPIAMFGILAAGLLIVLSQKKQPAAAPQGSSEKLLSPDQQAAIVTALQALGVDAGGRVQKRATPTAVERARSLARTLSSAGFPEAAATLNSYAAMAEKI